MLVVIVGSGALFSLVFSLLLLALTALTNPRFPGFVVESLGGTTERAFDHIGKAAFATSYAAAWAVAHLVVEDIWRTPGPVATHATAWLVGAVAALLAPQPSQPGAPDE